MQYYFNELDPYSFQRLINTILVQRFGEDVRLTPLYGSDGGRDGETAPGNPFTIYEVEIKDEPNDNKNFLFPKKGRYVFQVKFHRTVDNRISDARKTVVSEFEQELQKNVIDLSGDKKVNYFFLITNVPASKDAIDEVDQIRTGLLSDTTNLHADVWWKERVSAFLDLSPSTWYAFPQMFAGNKPPLLAEIYNDTNKSLPRSVRLAINKQYNRDSLIKFRQINLEKNLSKLFSDVSVTTEYLDYNTRWELYSSQKKLEKPSFHITEQDEFLLPYHHQQEYNLNALDVLLDEKHSVTNKILLEGGPGQGKSTITQMATQIYRDLLLKKAELEPENRWQSLKKVRLPFRIELRYFAEFISKNNLSSIEDYIASTLKNDSGGNDITVSHIHDLVEGSPVFLVFDGLDEIGSDYLRDITLTKIIDCVNRFEEDLRVDLKVVITTRPPAIAGKREMLLNFARFSVAPLDTIRTNKYLERWLKVQIQDEEERTRIELSFLRRRNEYHVKALIKNPMQLSILLHFIQLKNEAFPDRRAELYKQYFQIVIDRDVEKSPELRQSRDTIEHLHEFLGFKIHELTEAQKADGTLAREELLHLVAEWLKKQGNESDEAKQLFKLGEERLGLILIVKGEGEKIWYGYEIQPIREYFAAAFISNHIKGNAHDVFQEMIRRPFWREVVLFLAGLRRPNEKSDLIARAKALDSDERFGWKQDGRRIILQLLQEGVFSSLNHVYTEALDFMIDLLDPELVPSQHEVKDFLDVLPSLIKEGGTKKHKQRLLDLLLKYKSCGDDYVIYRIFKVAILSLGLEEVTRVTQDYSDMSVNLNAKLMFYWPFTLVKKIYDPQLFLQKEVPSFIWADALWQAIQKQDSNNSTMTLGQNIDVFIVNLTIPHSMHQFLLENFAFNPYTPYKTTNKIIKISSNLAVWRLLQCEQFFTSSLFGQSNAKKQFIEIIGDMQDVDLEGLNRPLQELLILIFDIYKELLFSNNYNDLDKVIENHLEALMYWLDESDILSRIACCCAGIIVSYVAGSKLESGNQKSFKNYSNSKKEALSMLWEKIEPFYDAYGGKGKIKLTHFLEIQNRFLFGHVVPSAVRLQKGGDLFNISDILIFSIRNDSRITFSWVNYIPFDTGIIKRVIEKCKDILPQVLAKLGSLEFVTIGREERLLASEMQQIIKVARNTNDRQVLMGTLVALSGSRFMNIIDINLLLRIIKASSAKGEFISFLFDIDFIEVNDHDKELTKLIEVANVIVESPQDYDLHTITVAADFLFEYSINSFPPLLEEEDRLGLQIEIS